MTVPWGSDPTSDPTVAIPVDPTDVQPLPLDLLVPEPGPPSRSPWAALAAAALVGAFLGGGTVAAVMPRTAPAVQTASTVTVVSTSTPTTAASASTTGGVIQPLTPTTARPPASRPKGTAPATTRATTKRQPPVTTATTVPPIEQEAH